MEEAQYFLVKSLILFNLHIPLAVLPKLYANNIRFRILHIITSIRHKLIYDRMSIALITTLHKKY